jgi:hypothetical protein
MFEWIFSDKVLCRDAMFDWCVVCPRIFIFVPSEAHIPAALETTNFVDHFSNDYLDCCYVVENEILS